jgi:hypothetical protein
MHLQPRSFLRSNLHLLLHIVGKTPYSLTPLRTCTRIAIRRDTRVLLCSTNGGQVVPMTENHHADALVEAIRLRRMMGSSLITDSFGESR